MRSVAPIVVCWGLMTPSLTVTGAEWRRVANPGIVPTPREVLATGREWRLSDDAEAVVVCARRGTILSSAEDVLMEQLGKLGVRRVTRAGEMAEVRPASSLAVCFEEARPPLKSGSYRLSTAQHGERGVTARILGDDVGILYGVCTFLKLLRREPHGIVVPEMKVTDEPALSVRGISPQWAWYLGNRGPYGVAHWGIDEWRRAIRFLAEYRFNLLALCTYGKFPFRLKRHQERCAAEIELTLWDSEKGEHTVRWTHPAYRDDFLSDLIEYAHAHGIRVVIYSCLNLQDEQGSRRWADERDVAAYCDIQRELLECGVDGFIFESGEFYLRDKADIDRFGRDEWARLRADVFLTRTYAENIRRERPDAIVGVVDHYLFKDWRERKVADRTGLEKWRSALSPEVLIAYVFHMPLAYEVFPGERIWTYVFGPKGGLKPCIQLHLSDSCQVPREKSAAGAYFVTYDWSPHEANYLCFSESAWGNYGDRKAPGFQVHSSEPGVGGDISETVWRNIGREMYGEGAKFGDGLRALSSGTPWRLWFPQQKLKKLLWKHLLGALLTDDLAEVRRLVKSADAKRQATQDGLAMMAAARARLAPSMVSNFPIDRHAKKAILLAKVQLAWCELVCDLCRSGLALYDRANDSTRSDEIVAQALAAASRAHTQIRANLADAYFSYPIGKLGKFEFLQDATFTQDLLQRMRARLAVRPTDMPEDATLENISPACVARADSTYAAGYYEAEYVVDGKMGTLSRGIWVSAETDPPHALEITLTKPARVAGLIVEWARDDRRDWAPQDFAIERWHEDAWRCVLQQTNNTLAQAVVRLEGLPEMTKLRIVVHRGPKSRPKLAAISEVEILAVRQSPKR